MTETFADSARGTSGTSAGGYVTPKRAIFTNADLECFKESEAYHSYVSFVEALSESVKGMKTRSEVATSKVTDQLVSLLDTLDAYTDQCPPIENPTRYGNPAFHDWYKVFSDNVDSLLQPIVVPQEAIVELREYLLGSFGSDQRIDFGTGHEANFAVFLYCLHKLGLLTPDVYPAVVLRVFKRYTDLTFKLQIRYWIEPAGSHGVWGLDDYHFLPFYFGASQLRGHAHIKPKAIHYAEYVDNFAPDYMYLNCIKNINSVKTESLAWHSPMLNDISAVKTWDKVHSGLLKMYKAEVLGKLPIMQHLKFGSLLHFVSSAPPPTQEELDATKHIQVFATCCAQNLPSAAAAKSLSERGGGKLEVETGSLAHGQHHSHTNDTQGPHAHAHHHSHAQAYEPRLIPFD